MANAAVPTPSHHNASARRCPDDLWALGERAIIRARRWADESAFEPTPRSAKLLSRILADPDGLLSRPDSSMMSCVPRTWTWPAQP